MHYQQLPPPELLKNYVRFFWVLQNTDSGLAQQSFTTMADGCPGLIFQQTENNQFYQNNKILPTTFLYGQATTHAHITLTQSTAIGVYFYPQALPAIFGFSAHELTNTCLNLDELTLSRRYFLTEQLLQTTSQAEQIQLLSNYLLLQICRNQRLNDALVNQAITQLIISRGIIPVKELQHALRLTERSLERRFKQIVGISPKMFSRICRFQATLRQLRAKQHAKLSDIAYENEYADQSHFIREFKQFAGVTPLIFKNQATVQSIQFPDLFL